MHHVSLQNYNYLFPLAMNLENNWSRRFKNCNYVVFFLTSFFRLTKHMAHRLAKCRYSKMDVPIVEVYTVTSVSQSLKVVEHCCGGTVLCEFFSSLGFMILHKVSMIHKQKRRFDWMKTITFSYPQKSSYYNCQFFFIVHLSYAYFQTFLTSLTTDWCFWVFCSYTDSNSL